MATPTPTPTPSAAAPTHPAPAPALSPRLLANKVAAITGGATGIGRAIALEYLRQGARVAVNHLGDAASEASFASLVAEAEAAGVGNGSGSGSGGNGTGKGNGEGEGEGSAEGTGGAAQEQRLIAVPGDIAKQETAARLVARTVETWGRLDVFVSNAGVCRFADFLDIDTEHFEFTLTTNLGGAFYATQAAARQMATQGHGGSIIGISSISALVGGARQTHYTPTKAGVLSLMQSCACALGPYGIRCNALLPGTIRTQLNEEDLRDEDKRRYMEGRIPLGRTGEPADLAGPAVFLASDLAAYVSGAQLLVDGGLFVNLQ